MFVTSTYLSEMLVHNVKSSLILLKATPLKHSFHKFKVKVNNIGIIDFFPNNLLDDEIFDVTEQSFDKVSVDFKKNSSCG